LKSFDFAQDDVIRRILWLQYVRNRGREIEVLYIGGCILFGGKVSVGRSFLEFGEHLYQTRRRQGLWRARAAMSNNQ
jgi:hypothetical protein